MPATHQNPEKKPILDLLHYYQCSPKNINNAKINYYLMTHRIVPGTRTYNLIEKYYNNHKGNQKTKTRNLNRSIFRICNGLFLPFFNTLNEYYKLLRDEHITGQKIMKYGFLINDFYCWTVLNGITSLHNVDTRLCLDYIHSRYFSSITSISEANDFIDAIHHFTKLSLNNRLDLGILRNAIPVLQNNFGIHFDNILDVCSKSQNSEIGLLITLMRCLGLPAEILINTGIPNLDFYNQIITYKAKYSQIPLVQSFDHTSKIKISTACRHINRIRLFYPDIPAESCMNQLYRDFTFELLNSRLPHREAKRTFDHLHLAVINQNIHNN